MLHLFKKKKIETNKLYAPANGTLVSLADVNDEVFSTGMMGPGLAIELNDDVIYAPGDGVITLIAQTNHAIGITLNTGLEILIHIGLDTVNFQGQGFEVLVKANESVTKGVPLIKIDRDFFKVNNVNLITPIIALNHEQFKINYSQTDITCNINTIIFEY